MEEVLSRRRNLLAHLAIEHEVGSRPGQRGRAANAGSVANAQGHPLTHPLLLRRLLALGRLGRGVQESHHD